MSLSTKIYNIRKNGKQEGDVFTMVDMQDGKARIFASILRISIYLF